MISRLIIRPEAEADLKAAHDWYEARQDGLGASFLVNFEAALEFISRVPEASPEVSERFRRHLMRQFPYGVFYFIDGAMLVVGTVMQASREPRQWQSRT